MDGSLKKVLYADGKSVEFTYDALGLISRIVDWTGTTNVERDSLGQIEKITDPKNRTVGYTYGSSGERTSITYPDGKRVDYLYDNMTRLSAIVDGANKTLYDYDENGRLSRKVLPNSVELQLSYLPGGYLKEMIARDDEGIIDSYVYSYDDSGRRSDVERHRRNLEHVSGLYHYDYDKIGRLTGVQRNNELIRSYSYDSLPSTMSNVT
ncbi:RHS repeat protein [Butyrivibrio sp. INlla16]|uniref:RHS repeat protein n=1 Tax=Butyrivibrio sp. INlla16 TaxID=1520807 RepID=UPI00088A2972|nr:RHS repeat protein [Butyrivibrio sp. INlla16]SDB19804.1 YD repeat-containing protein [Butyrivibrio sp. INlla16]